MLDKREANVLVIGHFPPHTREVVEEAAAEEWGEASSEELQLQLSGGGDALETGCKMTTTNWYIQWNEIRHVDDDNTVGGVCLRPLRRRDLNWEFHELVAVVVATSHLALLRRGQQRCCRPFYCYNIISLEFQ